MPEPRFGTGTLRTIYLGAPGSMEKLVVPNSGITMPFSRAAVAHVSIGGGTSYTRGPDARRAYAINWGAQTPDNADAILGFYLGTRGDGPFCLIDPSWRNQMGLDVSTMGLRFNRPDPTPGWDSTGEIPTSATSDSPAVPKSGVSVWASLADGQTMFEGETSVVDGNDWFTPDVTTPSSNGTAVPYLADQPHCLSVYARTRSGTAAVRWRALGLPEAGGDGSTDSSTLTIPLTTAWQRLWVTVYPSSYGFNTTVTPYVCGALTCVDAGTTGSSGLVISNAQHEIGVTRPSPWVAGVGVPRVLIGDPNNVAITVWDRRDQSLILTEM